MKVAHLIKTKSVRSDGRLLKWLRSLNSENIFSEVFVLEDSNKSGISYIMDMQICSTSLIFRRIFGKGKGYLFKIPEFTIRSLRYIRASDLSILIFHDVQHYLTLLFICCFRSSFKDKRIVWDLHELPHRRISQYFFTKKIIQFILSKVDLLVYTNKQRRQCILERFSFHEPRYVILNNYPEKSYITASQKPFPCFLKGDFRSKPYILWMGVAAKSRNFLPFLNSFERWNEDVNLFIMGAVGIEEKDQIGRSSVSNHIFSKFVQQEEILSIVDNALFSVVLYKQNSENNYYCEPNRLYQLVTRNIPVIVGNNPTMKAVVDEYKCGLVLPDDGTDEVALLAALEELSEKDLNGEFRHKQNDNVLLKDLCWDNQFSNVIIEILNL